MPFVEGLRCSECSKDTDKLCPVCKARGLCQTCTNDLGMCDVCGEPDDDEPDDADDTDVE